MRHHFLLQAALVLTLSLPATAEENNAEAIIEKLEKGGEASA